MTGCRHPLVLVLVLVLGGTSCARRTGEDAAPGFDPALLSGEAALRETAALVAIGLRDAGTPGAERAAEHIRGRLEALGVEATIDAFVNTTPRGEVTFRNVIGRIPGEGEGLIILGSHYDTKSGMGEGFEGANDSGSSTGLLLELGRVLAAGPRVKPDILLAFFDGEECMVTYSRIDGLHGSRHMAENLVREGRAGAVRAMILLDMIGDRDLSVTIPRNSAPRLVSLVFDAAHREGARRNFSLYPFEIGDDHVPFVQLGIPAIDLIDFHFGTAPGRNDYWHTPEDRMDKLSPESLGIVGRVVVGVVNELVGESP
ncbi:MAG: M28 family peptidase [Kiritimatiellae bacterium]|nr:M28 family peptidase [Kiritimatiellia bacterium]